MEMMPPKIGIGFTAFISVSLLLLAAFTVESQRRVTRLIWPKGEGVYIATSSESIPNFPRALSGYRSLGSGSYWGRPFRVSGSTRIFQGNGWEPLPNFPLQMNHCSAGVFMIRWRSANPNVRIESALGYHYTGVIYASKTGKFGYMQGTICEEPLLKFVSSDDTSTLVDVYYELRFWQAAP